MKKLAVAVTLLFSFAAFANNPLQNDMKVIGENYTKLGAQITDKSKNTDSEKLVQTMLEKSKSAMKQTPPGASTAKGPAKDMIVKKYKGDMQTMIKHLEEMKVALKKNDNDGAKMHYDALKPWTDESHTEQY